MVIEYLDSLLPVTVKLVSGSFESCAKAFLDCCYQTLAQETRPQPKLCGELQASVQHAVYLQAS